MIDHKPLKRGRFGKLPHKRPCVECPLRRVAKPGNLGGYTPEQYVETLDGLADLACHLSPGFPNNHEQQRSCTGVAMFRANLGIAPLARNAQAAVDHVGPNRRIVFASFDEFLSHHRQKP